MDIPQPKLGQETMQVLHYLYYHCNYARDMSQGVGERENRLLVHPFRALFCVCKLGNSQLAHWPTRYNYQLCYFTVVHSISKNTAPTSLTQTDDRTTNLEMINPSPQAMYAHRHTNVYTLCTTSAQV